MTKFGELKKGSILSEIQFYIVNDIKGDKIQLKNEQDELIVIDKDYAEKLLNSAEQFEEEIKLNRTDLIEQFLVSTNTAVTVCYNKQVKKEDVLKEILDAHTNTAPKDVEKAFKASIKKALEGEERIMKGRHYGSKDDFGRVHFIDMEIEKDASKSYDVRQRLVDPRTLQWFISKNKKYSVSK